MRATRGGSRLYLAALAHPLMENMMTDRMYKNMKLGRNCDSLIPMILVLTPKITSQNKSWRK